MNRLQTNYLGLSLKNPLVPSSSPLTKDPGVSRRMEDYGASAIILPSLFEEKIHQEEQQLARFLHSQELAHPEASSFVPVSENYKSTLDEYLEHLHKLKSSLGIPVIASLNGITDEGWIEHAKELQDAGADALELNIYYVAASINESSQHVESRYLDIIKQLAEEVTIPLTIKLPSQLSSIVHFAAQIKESGAMGLSLFNRFYQPDVDLVSLDIQPKVYMSQPHECLLRVRWIAIIRSQLDIDLAATGGIHNADDMAKALLAGADITHMCSALLLNGTKHISQVLYNLEQWMDRQEYESVTEFKGSLCQKHAIDPSAYERANYLDVLDSYTPPKGVVF
ncbi:MAG: dihydroorotate dehydrogenase-like protein [Gammaproteobacteria bacterium]|nr:dihydroorotate dehydrogenase-like protein [Gammaproteobacteria bacterium]